MGTLKLFEHIVCRHILDHVEDHKILTNLQHGFRSSRSCETQLITTTHGSFSNYADVESSVPQGTVLGPLLFLLHINDLPSCVNSKVHLFADDCLLYREIKNNQYQIDMQRDLDALMNW